MVPFKRWMAPAVVPAMVAILLAIAACGPSIASLELFPSSATISEEGYQYFRAIATDRKGEKKDVNYKADWSSANPSIAAVRNSGFADGLATGTTDVRVSFRGMEAKALLTLTPMVAKPPTPPPPRPTSRPPTPGTGRYCDNEWIAVSLSGAYAPAQIFVDGQGPWQNYAYIQPARVGSHRVQIIYSNRPREQLVGNVPRCGFWQIKRN